MFYLDICSSTETDIEEALKEAGGPLDEGISDIAKDSHFIINPSKASQEQVCRWRLEHENILFNMYYLEI